MDNRPVKEILDSWLKESERLLIEKYNSMGIRSSGDWEKSLKSEVVSTDDNDSSIVGSIYANKYTHQLVNGRQPGGKFPPIDAIRKWIDDKGIIPYGKISKNSLAYLIARKISIDGIHVPNSYNDGNLISDVITDERLNRLKGLLITVISKDVVSDITKTIK